MTSQKKKTKKVTKKTIEEEINIVFPLIDICMKCEKEIAHLITTFMSIDRDRVIARYECSCGKKYGYGAWMDWLLELYTSKVEKEIGDVKHWRTVN